MLNLSAGRRKEQGRRCKVKERGRVCNLSVCIRRLDSWLCMQTVKKLVEEAALEFSTSLVFTFLLKNSFIFSIYHARTSIFHIWGYMIDGESCFETLNSKALLYWERVCVYVSSCAGCVMCFNACWGHHVRSIRQKCKYHCICSVSIIVY
jgi:hypothetical protein